MTVDRSSPFGTRGAVPGRFEGLDVTAHFGDPAREWRAAREGAALIPASYRRLLAASGGDRVDFLQGMVSNDVRGLAPGGGVYAALLTQNGKVVTDLRVYADADCLLLDVPAWRVAAMEESLQRYLVADDVEIVAAPHQPLLQVEGPLARAVVGEALGTVALPAEPWGHVVVTFDGRPLRVVNAAEAGGEGVLLCGPDEVATRLFDACRAAGATPAGLAALDVLRIEAGIAWPGIDMDDSTLIMETGREAAISFRKGCYLGQEVVERIVARGHVNRALTGLVLDGDALPARGAAVLAEGRPVGYVTSAARSPLLDRVIALAIIQRKFGTQGERLLVADGAVATVTALPFAAPATGEDETS